ncbi:MAG TPA: hypothetical protein PLK84_07760, partial [Syntrophales bacterium]|nr:hypothetical protein [Syntrophales bacterium]
GTPPKYSKAPLSREIDSSVARSLLVTGIRGRHRTFFVFVIVADEGFRADIVGIIYEFAEV